MDHVAVRFLVMASSLLTVLFMPTALADDIETPPIGVPATTLPPECPASLNSRTYLFCSSGTQTVCVEDTACQGSSPDGACSQVNRLIVCVSRQHVGGGAPIVPSQTVGCFVYNGNAVTNMCLQAEDQNQTIPSVSVGTQNVCPVGTICQETPVPVMGTQIVQVPAITGYVEVTEVCRADPSAPCRVDL